MSTLTRPTPATGPPARVATRLPAVVRDLELTGTLPELPGYGPGGERIERAWLLIRIYTEPIGALQLDLPPWGLDADDLAAAIDRALGEVVDDRFEAAAAALRAGDAPPYLARRAEVLRDAPPLTAVVCTRDHPESLSRCLESLLAQRYPAFRVLVVDNAPTGSATAELVARAAQRGPVDYLLVPQPGLSRARNAAAAARPGETLAFIDDDEVADPHWLAEIARALADHPRADVVSGVIVPAELATDAQLWFEQFGGHSKGRGFTPDLFSPATARRQDPLYPLPPFGAGGNMTFRPGVIDRIGGFDPALGAGTPALGSEDTLAFTQVLLAGGSIAYQPTAVVRHRHHRDLAGLRRQLVGYGSGLTAAYTSLLLARPALIWRLLRLLPRAVRDVFGSGRLADAALADDFPRDLLRDNRRGMLRGPLAYLRGRRQRRRDDRSGRWSR